MIQNTFKVQTIGELLKEKREARELSYRQISEIIKIRPEYLEALEKGNYKVFVSEVYVKGFLKNYAKFLGIDQEKALALYRRENTENRNDGIKNVQEKSSRTFDFTITPEKIIMAVVAIISGFILYYLVSQVNTILENPHLALTAPVSIKVDSSGTYETDQDTLDVRGEISPDATLTLNGNAVTTNNFENFEIRDISLDLGLNEFLFIAESPFGRSSELSLTVNYIEKADEPIEEPVSEEAIPQSMDIRIEIGPRDANVDIDIDGDNQENKVFSSGETLTYTADKTLTIQTPRPDSVKVTINDEQFVWNTTNPVTWTLQDGDVVMSQ